MPQQIFESNLFDGRLKRLTKVSSSRTFLDIAGISHDENAWSDIYAYFLNPEEKHGLGRLFIDSLLCIIESKINREIDLDDFSVYREVVTDNLNRIDLLIKSKSHAIIIENKIHHILNNNLDDYWLSVPGEDNEKTGIVLSLSHILTNHSDFINITHTEWISEVHKRLNDKHYNLNPKTELFYNDFYQCIMEESKNIDSQNSKLYLENRENINGLLKIATETKERLLRIFTDKKFIRGLNGFSLVHDDRANSRYRYVMYKLPDTDELVITIYYEHLWNSTPGDARLLFFIEPLGNWLKKAEKLGEDIEKIDKEEGIGFKFAHEKYYWHCGGVECRIDENKILDAGFLKECIVQHLVNPESKLMKAAKRIAEKISDTTFPSYSWEDAMKELNRILSNIGGEDYANWELGCIKFIMYDRRNNIVVIEARDAKAKKRIERFLYNDLMSALQYAYGKNVRFSIICEPSPENG